MRRAGLRQADHVRLHDAALPRAGHEPLQHDVHVLHAVPAEPRPEHGPDHARLHQQPHAAAVREPEARGALGRPVAPAGLLQRKPLQRGRAAAAAARRDGVIVACASTRGKQQRRDRRRLHRVTAVAAEQRGRRRGRRPAAEPRARRGAVGGRVRAVRRRTSRHRGPRETPRRTAGCALRARKLHQRSSPERLRRRHAQRRHLRQQDGRRLLIGTGRWTRCVFRVATRQPQRLVPKVNLGRGGHFRTCV